MVSPRLGAIILGLAQIANRPPLIEVLLCCTALTAVVAYLTAVAQLDQCRDGSGGNNGDRPFTGDFGSGLSALG